MSILGRLSCSIGLHQYCSHPLIESRFYLDEDGESDAIYICPQCEQEFEFDGEKFEPISDAKWCLRGCGKLK